MPDQNQNSQNLIPGTLRTLKTDLDNAFDSPQDRLQQAGNFVQARPDIDSVPIQNHSFNQKPISTNINIENKTQDKKDISSSYTSSKPTYSWSNMTMPQDNNLKVDSNLDLKKSNQVEKNEPLLNNKSGFSALDDSISIPLDNTIKDDKNILNDSLSVKDLNINNNIQSDTNPFNLNDQVNYPKKSILKTIIPFIIIIILVVLIGGGVYLFISRNKSNVITEKPNPNPTPVPVPITEITPLFANIPKLNISFIDNQPIRQTILTQLNTSKDSLIELNLTKDGNKVALADIADVFSINIPIEVKDNTENYWLYGYNQQGIYKLTGVFQIKNDKNVSQLVENWANSIPRDLAGFSINSASRIVNIPTIKQSSITNSSGKVFKNYYYNYTSPTDSIDVSSYEKYLLIASSQDSMKYILNKIK